jgi:hypothetical protein
MRLEPYHSAEEFAAMSDMELLQHVAIALARLSRAIDALVEQDKRFAEQHKRVHRLRAEVKAVERFIN